jgi:hypothetical protein
MQLRTPMRCGELKMILYALWFLFIAIIAKEPLDKHLHLELPFYFLSIGAIIINFVRTILSLLGLYSIRIRIGSPFVALLHKIIDVTRAQIN